MTKTLSAELSKLSNAELADRLSGETMLGDNPLTIELMVEAAVRLRRASHAQGWRDIESAPKDGTYILLAGPSGYKGTPLRVEVCRYDTEFRPLQPWVDYAGDSFLDSGDYPTHWMPLPAPPSREEGQCPRCGIDLNSQRGCHLRDELPSPSPGIEPDPVGERPLYRWPIDSELRHAMARPSPSPQGDAGEIEHDKNCAVHANPYLPPACDCGAVSPSPTQGNAPDR